MEALQGIFGYAVFIALAWAISESRREIPWRTVVGGVLLQVALAVIILKLPGAQAVFAAMNDALLALEKATRAGTGMVFGYLGGGPLPFAEPFPAASFVLAFQALPIVLVMSALSALLFHWRILPLLVRAMSWLLGRNVELPRLDGSSMDAVTRGTSEGLQLLLNIVAMLIVLVALVALANGLLGLLPHEGAAWSLQRILGWFMAPLAWLAGVSWAESATAGALLGTKTVLNELVAYLEFAALPVDALSVRSRVIMTYALCGFANLGSLGIMIGGLTTMVPERRAEILELGPRTLVASTLATLSCGAVVGVLL